MKYYLGTELSGNNGYNIPILAGGTGHVLFSYADTMNPLVAMRHLPAFGRCSIIVDSGAFSIWNSGIAIDRHKLLAYYTALKTYRSDMLFINLDVIPGERNRKPTPAEASAACAAGLDNYYFFRRHGIDVLPVFHEDDDWNYLEIYKRETDYICISPANDSSVRQRMHWLDKVYGNLKADYKTHGLAATSKKLLERYPFYSVDSINWKAVMMYGKSQSNIGSGVSQASRHKQFRQWVLAREIKHMVELQDYITELWTKRGVTWTN